ncbi:MAG: hypothetical protein M2R45_04725 [Verrucomicrobia subdivision 3 bacterium]|nr:hypothetical protein [Limisphaerales bacterium]MCS1415745.1 hypothetical protein [Limisphaerales bacterium]
MRLPNPHRRIPRAGRCNDRFHHRHSDKRITFPEPPPRSLSPLFPISSLYLMPGMIQGFLLASDFPLINSNALFVASIQSPVVLSLGFFGLAFHRLPQTCIEKCQFCRPKTAEPTRSQINSDICYQQLRRNPPEWMARMEPWIAQRADCPARPLWIVLPKLASIAGRQSCATARLPCSSKPSSSS